jgi:hypothetical protein
MKRRARVLEDHVIAERMHKIGSIGKNNDYY